LNSRDFTEGYGPETYSLKRAMPGVYKIKAKYYANHQQSLVGGTTILLTLFTHYGVKGKEKSQQITIRLNQNKDLFDVGEIEIENGEITKIQNDFKKEEKLNQENKAKVNQLEALVYKLKREVELFVEKETSLLVQEKKKFENLINQMEVKEKEEKKLFCYEYLGVN
jgi:hypothetical protein